MIPLTSSSSGLLVTLISAMTKLGGRCLEISPRVRSALSRLASLGPRDPAVERRLDECARLLSRSTIAYSLFRAPSSGHAALQTPSTDLFIDQHTPLLFLTKPGAL
jgi:hypothetical protein